MRQAIQLLAPPLGIVGGVAVAWHLLFTLNAWLMASYTYAAWASWVFMPAALRIIAVLVLGRVGAAGLVIGALYTITRDPIIDLPYQALLALSSGAAPLLAVGLCRAWFRLGENLHGIGPSHIVALSVVGAATNSALSNAVLALAGHMADDWLPLVVVFLGDLNGTAMVLFSMSSVLGLIKRGQL